MTIRYLDLVNGNDANDGTTFALRKKTLGSASTGLLYADTVKVMASPEPTSVGQNATFTNGSDTITLTTAVTANIDTCETAWTAAANVTATAQTAINREGTNAAGLVVATAFTTGLIAYHDLGAAQDFSAYQQVSFLIRQSGKYADMAASTFSLRLCSDAAGAVPVHSFTLPLLSDQCWTALVFDNAAALGSAVRSIALYALLDPGGVTVAIDNVIACKAKSAADSLTHQSLISKNTGSEPWMAIDSINGTTIKLAGGYQSVASRSGYSPNYYGATATQTLYKREPIVVTARQQAGAACIIECGWDTTDMTTQSGVTFVRLLSPGVASTNQALLSTNSHSYGSLNKWYSVNALANGIIFTQGWTFGEGGAIACGAGFCLYQSCDIGAGSNARRYVLHCPSGIITLSSASSGEAVFFMKYMWGTRTTASADIAVNDASNTPANKRLIVQGCDVRNFFALFGNQYASLGIFGRAVFSDCDVAVLNRLLYTSADDIQFINSTLAYPPSGATQSIVGQTAIGGDATQSATTFGLYRGNGTVASATDQRHTASDFSWKVSFTGSSSFTNPISFSLAKIACVANEARTVKLWVYRGDSSGLFRLRVKGGYIAGIPTDLISELPADTATWIQITLEFTPTQQGVVDVFADACGSLMTDLWLDDLEVT